MVLEILIFVALLSCSVVFLYIAPAVAIAPSWIADPNRIFAIPLLSVGVVYGIAKLFFSLDIWNPLTVRITFGIVLVAAIVRSAEWFTQNGRKRSSVDWGVVAVVGILLLPILSELATAPFDSDDENTSWNYWAKLAFLGEPADLFYTRAPYPQLLPLLLSANYLLLGDWSYQLVVKAGLWMFSLSCFGLLTQFTIRKLGRVSALVIFMALVYFVDLRGEYRVAYADPLMTTFLFAGFYFLYQSDLRGPRLTNLWLASMFISLGAISKQAGLPWAMLFFPALYAIREIGNLRNIKYWGPLVMPILIGGIWLITEGKGALSNQGVVRASIGDRGITEQLVAALLNYGKRPELIATYLAFFIAVGWKISWERLVAALAIVASTTLWLIFGGYQFRLGIHNFLLAWFFFVNFLPTGSLSPISRKDTRLIDRLFIVSIVGLMASSILYSGLVANKKLRGTESISLLDGFGRQAWSFFGIEGADWVSELKSDSRVKVLVFSNYLNGMLSPEIKVARMENQGPTEDPAVLDRYIDGEHVTHVVTLGNQMYVWGAGNAGLKILVSRCPEKYRLVSEAKGNPIGLFIDFQAKLYRVQGAPCGQP